jgi:hypothetical protein
MGMVTQLPCLSQSQLRLEVLQNRLVKTIETRNLCFRCRHTYVHCDNTFIYKPIRYSGSDFGIIVITLDNWTIDITVCGWDIWAFVVMNLVKFIRAGLDLIPGQRMCDLRWTNWHWDRSLLRLLRCSSLIIIPPMLLLTMRSAVILAIGRVHLKLQKRGSYFVEVRDWGTVVNVPRDCRICRILQQL